MTDLDEIVARQRVQVVVTGKFEGFDDESVKGVPIDTADSSEGLFFLFGAHKYSSGIFRFAIQHSAERNGDFEDVGLEHMVYGWDDGRLPIVTRAHNFGTIVPRAGVIGTKRWVTVNIYGEDKPVGELTVYAIKNVRMNSSRRLNMTLTC